jgi:DNA (cytosine-5)-methyltransferase 1
MSVSIVDLFCGVGGLTRGLIDAGLPVRAGVDFDPQCRYPYEANNDGAVFIERKIADPLLPELLEAIYGPEDVRILVGCAPCQPFSSHTQKYRYKGADERGGLLYNFSDMIRRINPTVVAMENVTRLLGEEIFADFLRALDRAGFTVWAKSVYCPNYGVPQIRRRLVLLASRLGPIELTPPTHQDYPTVLETIGHLEAIPAGGTSTIDPLHRSQGLSPLNFERIRQAKPGGSWHDWDERLRAKCHLKDSGSTYTAVYSRMRWEAPAPTITTQFYAFGTGRFGHPEQNRALSLREGALLQTFPQNYAFVAPWAINQISMGQVGAQIGNAVPINLAKAIGQSIHSHLTAHNVL